jgi:Zn-dependent alcohol dehydrogenase
MAVSSLSEYTVVDMNQVVKLDPAVPPMLGCGYGTGEPSSFFFKNNTARETPAVGLYYKKPDQTCCTTDYKEQGLYRS